MDGITPQRADVNRLENLDESCGLAAAWLRQRSAQAFARQPIEKPFERTFYENVLNLWRPDGTTVPMQVGIVAVTRHGKNVGWTSNDFFVPPSLWGAGIGWQFLKQLLQKEADAKSEWCYVVVKLPQVGSRHQVGRDDYRSFIEQYRKIGFRELRLSAKTPDATIDEELWQQLEFSETDEDTLLALDLQQWKKRQ